MTSGPAMIINSPSPPHVKDFTDANRNRKSHGANDDSDIIEYDHVKVVLRPRLDWINLCIHSLLKSTFNMQVDCYRSHTITPAPTNSPSWHKLPATPSGAA
jgi:hypothetical protein